jgi:hypothetical protein
MHHHEQPNTQCLCDGGGDAAPVATCTTTKLGSPYGKNVKLRCQVYHGGLVQLVGAILYFKQSVKKLNPFVSKLEVIPIVMQFGLERTSQVANSNYKPYKGDR